jgi:hypothetical protein
MDSSEYESELDQTQTDLNTTEQTSATKRKTATSYQSDNDALNTTQITSTTRNSSKRKTRLAGSRVTEEDQEENDEDEDENDSDEDNNNNNNENTTYQTQPVSGSEDPEDDDDNDDSDEEEEDASETEMTQHTQENQITDRSQGSMNVDSDRFSSMNKSIVDDDLLNATKRNDELNQTQAKIKKIPKNFKLNYYINSKNEFVYPVSAKAFYQFETMLFDTLGFKQEQVYDPEDADFTKIDDLVDFDEPEYSSAILSDTRNLYHQLDFSNPYEPKLAKLKQSNMNQSSDLARDKLTLTQSAKHKREYEIKTAKIITVMVNGPTRPRKAARILLNKRNTANFDLILNDICTSLKVDNSSIKKIYNLKGVEVSFMPNTLTKLLTN